jgi:hypothetical protein
MKMFAVTQYYSMDCDSALGISMHEASIEVHHGKGYAYCPILSWKMALVTSYNDQKELNLGANESMRFLDQLNFHSQPLNHCQSLDQHHSWGSNLPHKTMWNNVWFIMDNILQGV